MKWNAVIILALGFAHLAGAKHVVDMHEDHHRLRGLVDLDAVPGMRGDHNLELKEQDHRKLLTCPLASDLGSFTIDPVAQCVLDPVTGLPVFTKNLFVPSEFVCTAKDLTYVSCRLVPVSGDPCIDCQCGSSVAVNIECTVINDTNSERAVAYVVGQLIQSDGSCSGDDVNKEPCNIALCKDVNPFLLPGVPTEVLFDEVIQWDCGANINFQYVILGSKPTSSTCASLGISDRCNTLGPKCDPQDEFPIAAPVSISATAACATVGDTTNEVITYTISGGAGPYTVEFECPPGTSQGVPVVQAAVGEYEATFPACDGAWDVTVTDSTPPVGCPSSVTINDLICCDVEVTASAQCNQGLNQGLIKLTAVATSSFLPITYSWEGPDGEPAGDTAILENQEQGTWKVTATDNNGCEETDTVDLTGCCQLAATCIREDDDNEGCDADDFPDATTTLSEVWTVATDPGPCGTPTLLLDSTEDTGVGVCDMDGLIRTYTFGIFDDLNADGEWNPQTETKLGTPCEHIERVKDTLDPTITPPNPADEDCDSNSCVFGVNKDPFTDCFPIDPTYSDDCTLSATALSVTGKTKVNQNGCVDASPAGTYTKTWTVTDQCGRKATASADVVITDDAAPVITCPGPDSLGCASDLGVLPTIDAANDACEGAVTPVYNGCCFDTVDGLTLDRTWTATDSCGIAASCTQENPLTSICPTPLPP